MGMIQRLYDFISGTRISSQQVDEEFNQLVGESNSKETRVANLESNKVPYTGATKDVDLNQRAINALGGVGFVDTSGDGKYFRWNEDANGFLALKIRSTIDDAVILVPFTVTPSGVMGVPNQPSILASPNAHTNMAANTSTIIPLATTLHTHGGMSLNTTTKKITIAETGTYLIGLNYFADTIATQDANLFADLYVNDIPITTFYRAYSSAANGGILGAGFRVMDLNKNDTVSFYTNGTSTYRLHSSTTASIHKLS